MARPSCQLIVIMMAIMPTISMPLMMMFSGPWWAASLMSNRSLTTRLTMSPVLTRSYQENEKRSYWSNRSWRMRVSMRTPMM